jgi:predicted small lipoprotein YifL
MLLQTGSIRTTISAILSHQALDFSLHLRTQEADVLRVQLFGIVLASLALAGCGDGGPKTYPVSGKVTVGGAPLENVNVTFNPADSSMPVGTGRTKTDGTYTLSSGVEGKEGVPPGKYKVTLQPVAAGGKDAAMAAYGKKGGTGSGPPTIDSKVPKEYTSVTTTPKEVEVTAGDNTVNLEL